MGMGWATKKRLDRKLKKRGIKIKTKKKKKKKKKSNQPS